MNSYTGFVVVVFCLFLLFVGFLCFYVSLCVLLVFLLVFLLCVCVCVCLGD